MSMEREWSYDTSIYVSLRAITCGGCGTAFAMSESLYKTLVDTRETFYCPRGCRRTFCGKTEEERLREEVEVQKRSKEHWIAETKRKEAQLRAEKGAKTKLKKRIANGVCPCCKRSFCNLRRHMETKHPGYTP